MGNDRLTPSLQKVTPESIKQLCKQLDGSSTDPLVLAVAKLVLSLPLPKCWKHAVNAAGTAVFIDRRTGQSVDSHPNLAKGRKLLRTLKSRATTAGCVTDGAVETCLSEYSACDHTAQQAEGNSPEQPGPSSTDLVVPQNELEKPGNEHDSKSLGAELQEHSVQEQTVQQAIEQESANFTTPNQTSDDKPTGAQKQPVSAEQVATQQCVVQEHPTCLALPLSDLTNHQLEQFGPQLLIVDGIYYYDFSADAVCTGEPTASNIIPEVPKDILEELCIPPSAASGPPQQLTFYSWWIEDTECNDLTFRVSSNSIIGGGLSKRYCTINFDMATQTFQIRIDAGNAETQIGIGELTAVRNDTGDSVSWLDLHVGYTVELLGKRVPLLKASLATSQWLDHIASQLLTLKQKLQDDLQKYKPRAMPVSTSHNYGNKEQLGGLALRITAEQVTSLIADLKQYRPQIASKYHQQIEGLLPAWRAV